MLVIPPVEITDSMLLSSNVEESGLSAYVPGTTYPIDAYVTVLTELTKQTVYQSLQPANLGHDPATSPLWWKPISVFYKAYDPATTYASGSIVTVVTANSHRLHQSIQGSNLGKPVTDPLWWYDYGVTNRWAAFDLLRNTKAIRASPMVFTVKPGLRTNSLFITGMLADSVRIEIITGVSTVIYDMTINLSTRNTVSWLTYYTGQFYTRESVIRFDLPMFTDAQYRITLLRSSGNVELGGFGVGVAEDLGRAQWQASSDSKNFSTVERTMQGDATMIPRRRIPKTSQTTHIPKTLVPRILKVREDLDARPAYWAGLVDDTNPYFKALEILGFYTKFVVSVDNVDEATLQIDLEEI